MTRPRTTRSRVEAAPLVVYGVNAVLELLRSGEPVDRLCLGRGPREAELSAAASAGLLFGLPVAQVPNLVRAMEALKAAGFWLVGLSPRGGTPPAHLEPPARPAVVAGGEGGGLRPLVHRTCDFTASIPMAPGVESLNVGVAIAIALYELTARRVSS